MGLPMILLLSACAGTVDDTAPTAVPDDSHPVLTDSRETSESETSESTAPDDTAPDTVETGPPPADVDGDGYGAAAEGGDDCDDEDARTHPGAAELCDYADRDCDGDPYAPGVCDSPPAVALVSWATWTGDLELEGHLGRSVAIPGDLDGDGLAEVSMMCAGCDATDGFARDAVYLVANRGALPTPTEVAEKALAMWVEDDTFVWMGETEPIGDVDGDGWDDFVFTGYESASIGWLAVQYGPWDSSWPRVGHVDTSTDAWWWSGSATRSGWGDLLAGPGDLDGDGAAELIVGRRGTDLGGALYLVPGGDWRGEAEGTADAWRSVTSPLPDEATRRAVYELEPAGDFNGDGLTDLLVARNDTTESITQTASVLDGAALDYQGDDFLDVALATWGVPAEFGRCLSTLGDWNADGYADVAVNDSGMTDAHWPATATAGIWVMAGQYGTAPAVPIEDAAYGRWHDSGGNWLNSIGECRGGADFDGDLLDDFVLGGLRMIDWGADTSALNPSTEAYVFLFPGRDGLPVGEVELSSVALPIATAHQDTDADPELRSTLGATLAFGDLTGDGLADIVAADEYAENGAGAVHVLPGWEIPWSDVRGE